MRSPRWRNRAFSGNKRVIKLHWNYIVRYTRQRFGFLAPVDRTGFPVDVSVNFDYSRMENFHPRWIAALQFDFFSPSVRTNSQIRNPHSESPGTLTLFFSCTSSLAGKPVLITSLNSARNFPFLTNVISRLLTVSWSCLFFNVGRESDVLSKRFQIMPLTVLTVSR